MKSRHWAVDHAREPVLWVRSMNEVEVQGIQRRRRLLNVVVNTEFARTSTWSAQELIHPAGR